MRKKTLCLLFAALMALSMAACGNNNAPPPAEPTEADTPPAASAPDTSQQDTGSKTPDDANAYPNFKTFVATPEKLVDTFKTIYSETENKTLFDITPTETDVDASESTPPMTAHEYNLRPGVTLTLFDQTSSGELCMVMLSAANDKMTDPADAKIYGGLSANLLSLFESDESKQLEIESELGLGDFTTERNSVSVGSLATWMLSITESSSVLTIIA